MRTHREPTQIRHEAYSNRVDICGMMLELFSPRDLDEGSSMEISGSIRAREVIVMYPPVVCKHCGITGSWYFQRDCGECESYGCLICGQSHYPPVEDSRPRATYGAVDTSTQKFPTLDIQGV